MNLSSLPVASLLLALELAAAPALAVNAQKFRMAPGAQDVLTVQSATTLEAGTWQAGLTATFARDPFTLLDPFTGERLMPVVGDQWTTEAWGAYGLFDGLELGVGLSLTQQATQAAPQMQLAQAPASFGLGDLRLVPKYRLLQRGGFAFAVSMPVVIPTGSQAAVLGGAWAVQPRLVADWEGRSGLRFSALAGASLQGVEQLGAFDTGSATELQYGASASLPVSAPFTFRAFAALWGGVGLGDGQVSTRQLELQAGVALPLTQRLALQLAGGPGFTEGFGTAAFRATASLVFAPSTPRRIEAPTVAAPPQLPPPMPEPIVAAPTPEPIAPPEPEPHVMLRETSLHLDESIYFDTAKDVIQQRSFELLEQVAKTLIEHPELGHVRVEGHTDDEGRRATNIDLSRRRAIAVMRFLIEQGVAAERLTSEGFGPDRPIVENTDEASRAKNRRVEFVLVPTEAADAR